MAGGAVDGVARLVTVGRAQAHRVALVGGKTGPGGEEVTGSVEGVGGGKAGSIGDDGFVNVDLVGDEDRFAAGEGFDDGEAEVFLMAGEDKGFAPMDQVPFVGALDHGDKTDRLSGQGPGPVAQRAEEGGIFPRSGDDKAGQRMAGGEELSVGFEQEVGAFFGMDAAEEQKIGLVCPWSSRGRGWFETEGDDGGPDRPRGEEVVGAAEFFVAGEDHGGGIAEHPVFDEFPVNGFFPVFDRVKAAVGGVEHAVGKNQIGGAGAGEGAADGDPVVLPESVDEHRVVTGGAGAEPIGETGRAAARSPSGPGVDRIISGCGPVERGDINVVSLIAEGGGEGGNIPGHAPVDGIDRGNGLEQVHLKSDR